MRRALERGLGPSRVKLLPALNHLAAGRKLPHNQGAKAVAAEVGPTLLRTVGGRVSRIWGQSSQQQLTDPRGPVSSPPRRPGNCIRHPEHRLAMWPSVQVVEPVDCPQRGELPADVPSVAPLRALCQFDHEPSNVQLDQSWKQLCPTSRPRFYLRTVGFGIQRSHPKGQQRRQKGPSVAILHFGEVYSRLPSPDLVADQTRRAGLRAPTDDHDGDPVAPPPAGLVGIANQSVAAQSRAAGSGHRASWAARHIASTCGTRTGEGRARWDQGAGPPAGLADDGGLPFDTAAIESERPCARVW